MPKDQARDERRHIALVGFAGSGKSTVGKLLAESLGAEFVDLDLVISQKAGRPLAALIREHGEVGLRAHERLALREILQRETPLIIATGSATFADAAMRGWVQQRARTVYLKVSPEELSTRLGARGDRTVRPLRVGPDRLVTIKRLLADRAPAYELCDITMSCDRKGRDKVAAEIAYLLRCRTARADARAAIVRQDLRAIKSEPVAGASPATSAGGIALADGVALLRVHAALGSYPVELRPEAGPWIAQALLSSSEAARVAVISDTTVAGLHGEALLSSLRAGGKLVTLHTFEPGEGSKTLTTAARLYDELLVAGLCRSDLVVALGGGVVGDVAGFVASTFLRGVSFAQVPTTTLAAVDSSVGGKTGVNTERGKNLVGTFYPPRVVAVAAAHLATQTPRQHIAGLVEAVKMASALSSEAFAEFTSDALALKSFDAAAVSRAVGRAVALKAMVVGRDEHERGMRAVLNYGHTIGHAIEVGEDYRLLHGEAVALGMIAEAEWAEATGRAVGVVAPLRELLGALGAPVDWRSARVDVDAMRLDKKRREGGVLLPIVTSLGTYELVTLALDDLVDFLK